jgi:hypothetical protein
MVSQPIDAVTAPASKAKPTRRPSEGMRRCYRLGAAAP